MVICLPREYGAPTPKTATLDGRLAVDRVRGEVPLEDSVPGARFPEVRPEEREFPKRELAGKLSFVNCKEAKFTGDRFAADKSPEETPDEERPEDKIPAEFDPDERLDDREERPACERLEEESPDGSMFGEESEDDERPEEESPAEERLDEGREDNDWSPADETDDVDKLPEFKPDEEKSAGGRYPVGKGGGIRPSVESM